MKKLKLIKYRHVYMYATDDQAEIAGSPALILPILSKIITGMKENGIEEKDIREAVELGLEDNEWNIVQVLSKLLKDVKGEKKDENNR